MPISRRIRLAYDSDGDGQNLLGSTGDPMGITHSTQDRGLSETVLMPSERVSGETIVPDFYYGSNSFAAANLNLEKLNNIAANCPESGLTLIIPHDFCVNGEFAFPRRTITPPEGGTYTNIPIPFEIRGMRPGVTWMNLASSVAISSDIGPTTAGVIYSGYSSRQILRNLDVVSMGAGIRVTGNGVGFYADGVTSRARGAYGWWFDQCFGLSLGWVGAINGLGDGFYFTDCIQVEVGHMQSRYNQGVGIKCRGNTYRCMAFSGSYDCEGNVGYQMDLDKCQQWSVVVYEGDGTYRTKLTNSSRMTIKGNYVIGSTDRYTQCLNPDIIPRGEVAYTNNVAPYKSSLATATLTNSGTSRFRLQCPAGESGFVRIWDSLDGGSDNSGTVVSSAYAVRVRFIVRSSSATVGTVGVLSWKSNGSTPTDLSYDIPGDGVFEMEGFPTHDTINYIAFTPNTAGTTDVNIEIASVTQLGYAP